MSETTPQNPISRAIELVGLNELAKRMGVTYQAVRYWERERGGLVPDDRLVAAVDATNGRMTARDFRPDLAALFDASRS